MFLLCSTGEAMPAIRRQVTTTTLPFPNAEEAWLWTMAILLARRDGADLDWRPDALPRPCDPGDVVRCLDQLYHRGGISLRHVRVLRHWGERQSAPGVGQPQQATDHRLWQHALGQLEWLLRPRGIVH